MAAPRRAAAEIWGLKIIIELSSPMHILALLGNMESLLCTKLRIPFLWHHANLTAPSCNERIPDVATPEFHISIVTAPAPAPALSNCVSQLGAGPHFNYIWKKVHIQKNINSHHLRVKSLNMLYVIYGVAGGLPGAKMIENKDKVEKRKIRVDFRSI